jgi:hypothetical protein
MASITLRSAVGRPLTNSEVDANFSALNLELGQKLVASLNLLDLPNPAQARSNLGLGNVENKSSATIRGELTSGNVTGALGYTPFSVAGGTITGASKIQGLGVLNPTTSDSTDNSILSLRATNALVRLQFGTRSSGNYAAWIQASYDNGGDGHGIEPLELNPLGGSVYANGNQVLNSANYGAYALPLSGGSSMTGPLTWGLVGDNVNGSSWYGIGRANSDFYGSGSTQMQVAGYYGLRLRTASAILDIRMGSASFNLDFDINGGLMAGGLGRSALNGIGGNIGATAISWNNAQLEIKNTDAGTVGIALHRAGYTSNSISVTDGNGIRLDGNIAFSAGNYANYALPLSGGTISGLTVFNAGISVRSPANSYSQKSFAVASGESWSSGASYVHILLPARYNSLNNKMFQLCIQGYALDVSGNRNINLMISGYVTTIANGGPINAISVWDATGQYSPTAYYSNTYSRGVCRFYLSNRYYTTFVVDAIQAGNGDVIYPGELQIIFDSQSIL